MYWCARTWCSLLLSAAVLVGPTLSTWG